MPAPLPGFDISVKAPEETKPRGLFLVGNEDGSVAFRRSTRNLLPTSAPAGAADPATFPADIEIEYEFDGAELGVGHQRFVEGGRVAGRSLGVDTRFRDIFFPGPKVNYIGDMDILAGGGDFETFSSGIPVGWAKINGGETCTEETTIVDANNGSTSSAKVVSAGSGHGIREVLAHGEYAQCVIQMTGSVFVPSGDAAATMRIRTNIGNTDVNSVGTNAWETFTVEVTVGAAVLSTLTLDLIPTNGDTTYWDNVKFQITKLTGPAGDFAELANVLYHASGRTVWKLDTHWKAQDVATQNIKAMRVHDATMYRALGGSTLWQSATNLTSWSNNGRANDDRYADIFASTQSRNGTPILWKVLLNNKLAGSTVPNANQWLHYVIGGSDANIIDLVVVENIMFIVKEDGVWSLGQDGIPRNLTPDWETSRAEEQGLNGAPWLGKAYLPASRQSLWEFDVGGARRAMHPAVFGSDVQEYNGKVTAVIGDGGWLYAFLQDPTDVANSTVQLMAGRPFGDAWRWGHLAQIDAGRIEATWITQLGAATPQMHFASADVDTSAAASVSATESGTGSNRDNSSAREWANPTNAAASDDSRAIWPDDTPTTGEKSSNVEASQDYTPGLAWADPGNAAASDNAYATAAFANASSTRTAGTIVSGGGAGVAWSNPSNGTANNESVVTIGFGGSEDVSEDLLCDNFSFAIPSTATVTGIRADIMEASSSPSNATQYVYDWSGGSEVFLLKAGVPGGTNHAGTTIHSNSQWAGTENNRQFPTHGSHHDDGSTHLWGHDPALTPSDINHADFGVSFVVYGKNVTGSFDYVQITVWYDESTSDGLRVTDFTGISLPSDAVINGITVTVHRKASVVSKVADTQVRLVKAGALAGDDKASTDWWPTTEATEAYGGVADLWGTTWTKAQVEATGFGVEIRCDRDDTTAVTASVDHITVNIAYTTSEASDYLDIKNLGFEIPTGATIDGVLVSIERSQSGSNSSVKDTTVSLLNASGAAFGDNKALNLTAWPTSDIVQEYGGASDMWGNSLTEAICNDVDFGVTVNVTGDAGTDSARVDHVTITVYYTPGAGSDLDNRLGWVTNPVTENPRHSSGYQFADDVTLRTGLVARFPGWQTSFHEVRVISSNKTNEALGSSGRQVKVKYDIRDGNGFVELGGSGTFTTSPRETRYFKETGDAGVIAEEIELEFELETSDESNPAIVEKIILAGSVRPLVVTVFELTVLVTDRSPGIQGTSTQTRKDVLTTMRLLPAPGSPFELYDRDGDLHYCLVDTEGYVEEDVMHYPNAFGEPIAAKAISMRCFEVPNSSSWTA